MYFEKEMTLDPSLERSDIDCCTDSLPSLRSLLHVRLVNRGRCWCCGISIQ